MNSSSHAEEALLHRAQLADLVLLLGFDVFPEDVAQQRALTLVFLELFGLRRAGRPASLPPALPGKRQGVSCGAESQERQRPHGGIPVRTKDYGDYVSFLFMFPSLLWLWVLNRG